MSVDQEYGQKARIIELEAEIEKACQDEDYDRAGDFWLRTRYCVLCYCCFDIFIQLN